MERAGRLSGGPATARLQAILDALTEAVFVVDRNDVVTASNAAARRLLAGEVDPTLAEPAALAKALEVRRLDGDPLGEDERPRLRALRGDHLDGQLLRLRRPGEAEDVVVEVSTAPVPGPLGAVGEVVIAVRDVTGHVNATRDLALARHQLEEVVEAGGVGLWDRNLLSGQVSYSTEWKRQIGYLPHEISDDVGEFLGRVHPDDAARVAGVDEELRLGLRRRSESTFRFRHRDGSYRHILARASLVHDETGRPVRLVGNHIDISERVQMEHRLAQANRLESVGRLAGGIAHEFNNLLAAVGLSIEVAAGDVEAAGAGGDTAARLRQVADLIDQGKHLTRQLLALSHAPVLEAVVLDLHEQVASMRDTLDRLLGETVSVEIQPVEVQPGEIQPGEMQPRPGTRAPATVRMDPGQLHQLLLNLAINARDAMPDGGLLTLAVENRPSPLGVPGAVLRVQDTGHGMDAATLEQAVDPLFTTKPTGRGTGLGLALVHSVVEKSGGSLSLVSTPGTGTTVEIWLPLVDAPCRPGRTQALPGTGAGSGAGRRGRGGEDDPSRREGVGTVLRGAGYDVLVAESAAAARAAVAGLGGLGGLDRLDVLLCDLVLPDAHGSALAVELNERQPGARVLLMSGYTDDPAAGTAVSGGRLPFLAKPFTAEDLLARLGQLLDAEVPAGGRERPYGIRPEGSGPRGGCDG
ncbi:MAG: ATP-binding protein [Motilibacteraceae bacterium]